MSPCGQVLHGREDYLFLKKNEEKKLVKSQEGKKQSKSLKLSEMIDNYYMYKLYTTLDSGIL